MEIDADEAVPLIVVTPPSPPPASDKAPDSKTKQRIEREAFFRKLMSDKKPLLQRQKSNPTPIDMTKEESIVKYIAVEMSEDEDDSLPKSIKL
jgi:hypothetical protein